MQSTSGPIATAEMDINDMDAIDVDDDEVFDDFADNLARFAGMSKEYFKTQRFE